MPKAVQYAVKGRQTGPFLLTTEVYICPFSCISAFMHLCYCTYKYSSTAAQPHKSIVHYNVLHPTIRKLFKSLFLLSFFTQIFYTNKGFYPQYVFYPVLPFLSGVNSTGAPRMQLYNWTPDSLGAQAAAQAAALAAALAASDLRLVGVWWVLRNCTAVYSRVQPGSWDIGETNIEGTKGQRRLKCFFFSSAFIICRNIKTVH